MDQPTESHAAPAEQPAANKWVPWLIILAVALTFGRVIGNGIAPEDDRSNIYMNPRMSPLDHAPTFFGENGVAWYWSHSDLALYIPMTYTVWFFLAKATWVQTPDENGLHLDPHIFHGASLLLHVVNTLLVYVLLRKLLRTRGVTMMWPAFAGALLYGLHPLQVESVAWSSGMKDLLYCGFSLLALLAYFSAVAPEFQTSQHRRLVSTLFHTFGILAMIIGMLCKPTAMVVPLLALIIDWLIVGRRLRRVVLTVLPYLLAAIPLMIVAKIVQSDQGSTSGAPWQRLIVAGASLAFYLGKLIVPINPSFDYGWRPTKMLHVPWFWWLALLPSLLGVVLYLLRRQIPWVAAGALIGAAALLPVLGLVPFSFQYFSTVADHYVVLAMLGPAVALAGILCRYAAGLYWVPLITGAVLIFFGCLSFHHLHSWRTAEDECLQILAVNPESSMAHDTLGHLYQEHGQLSAAQTQYLAATRDPLCFEAWHSLAKVYASLGEPRKALAAFHQAVEVVNQFPADLRPDLENTPSELAREAMASGHLRDVPVYLAESLRLQFARTFESWLGGPSVKYLPSPIALPTPAGKALLSIN